MRFRAERWSTAVLKPGTWADWFLVAQGTTTRWTTSCVQSRRWLGTCVCSNSRMAAGSIEVKCTEAKPCAWFRLQLPKVHLMSGAMSRMGAS